MADYKVGNLQIVFNAVDETSKAFDNLAKNLNAVKKAISNIGSLGASDLNKFGDSLDKIREKFSPLLADINGASAGLTAFNETTKRLGINKVSQVAQAFSKATEEAQKTASAVGDIVGGRIVGGANLLNKTVNKVAQGFNNLNNVSTPLWERNKTAVDRLSLGIDNLRQKLSRLNLEEQDTQKEQGKTEKATKKGTSGFGKLFNSIKRIALYRLIRTALKAIASSLTETAKAFAQVDDGVNDTMSQLTSSLNIIKLSFGATLLPILQMITPIIQQIGLAFANVANMISQAMSTTGTYTKINTDLIKNYRGELEKTGSLLDFDKIRSLNQKSGGLSDFLLPNQEVDEKNEKIIKLRETIKTITNIIQGLWNVLKSGWPAIQPFVETALDIIANTLLPIIQKVVDFIGKVVNKINELGLTEPIIYAIIAAIIALGANKVIKSIKNLTGSFNSLNLAIGAVMLSIALIANWDSFDRQTQKTITVIASLIAILTAAATAALYLNSALTFGTGVALVLTAVAAGVVAMRGMIGEAQNQANATSNRSSSGIRFKANGGSVPAGSLFYAGEAGVETVSYNNGRTEVTNVSQMETAFYNALVRYSNQNRGQNNEVINLNIDGRTLVRATRQAANKEGLDFTRISRI